jgi:hypothetical protein
VILPGIIEAHRDDNFAQGMDCLLLETATRGPFVFDYQTALTLFLPCRHAGGTQVVAFRIDWT